MRKRTRELSARVLANRRNARKSTGPRTQAGKAKVARNALIHGFAATAAAAPQPDLDRLAALIAGEDPSPERLELAREIARADADVRRARRVRNVLQTLRIEPALTPESLTGLAKEFERTVGLITRFVEREEMSKRVYKGRPLKIDNYPRFRDLFQKMADVPQRLEELESARLMAEFAPLTAAQERLLDRYEADALRRRKRAIAALDRFVQSSQDAPPDAEDGSRSRGGPQTVTGH